MEKQLDTTRFYALDKLSDYSQTILTLAEILPVYRKRLDKFIASDKARAKEIHALISKEFKKLSEIIVEARLCLLEIGEEQQSEVAYKLSLQMLKFNPMTPDYSKLSAVLTAFSKSLPSYQTTNTAIIGRLMNNVRMGFYPTDVGHIRELVRGISFPEGVTTNLFDPCCGEGLALRALADGNNCMTYGIELDQSRAEEAQERLHRVGFGSFFHSRISNEAFHTMLLNPPYLSVMNEGGGKSRHEKRFLAESFNYLMIGGLIIYIIPYYRLTADIARILCDNFTDLTVYRFMDEEFKKFSQIAVLGVRQKRIDGSSLVKPFMEGASKHLELQTLDQIETGRYTLPAKPQGVSIFKGAQFNVEELARQLAKSNSISKKLASSGLDNREKRPILPLNIGQIGLIGGSGMINGLAMCETPHIIKGRIVKEVTSYEDVTATDNMGNARVTEQTEITSNKLIFNILTKNGFKSLT